MRIANLKKWIGLGGGRSVLRLNEAGLRVLSIALAIGLWFFVNAGERGSVIPLTVPISYRSLPAGMAIMNHPPDFVTIEVAGPRTLLSLLEPERLSLRLDLRGIAPGQSDFKIFPTMFNVPRGTNVTRVSPDQISLDFDRLVSREVPVKLVLEGKVAEGFRIASIDVRPPTVTINGPSRNVSQISQVETQPFD